MVPMPTTDKKSNSGFTNNVPVVLRGAKDEPVILFKVMGFSFQYNESAFIDMGAVIIAKIRRK